jgi:hypothetical protein
MAFPLTSDEWFAAMLAVTAILLLTLAVIVTKEL